MTGKVRVRTPSLKAGGGFPRIATAAAPTDRDLAFQRLFARARDAAIADLDAQGIEVHGSDTP